MIERTAFISAHNKDGVPALAQALDGQGINIVSLGNTKRMIEAAGVSASLPLDFLQDELVTERVRSVEERERREIVAMFLAQHMCQTTEELAASGRSPIDIVYINLMEPTPTAGGVRSDKGGLLMLQAAIEGGRSVLTQPDQLPSFITRLETGPHNPESSRIENLALGTDTNGYLEEYIGRARSIGESSLRNYFRDQ